MRLSKQRARKWLLPWLPVENFSIACQTHESDSFKVTKKRKLIRTRQVHAVQVTKELKLNAHIVQIEKQVAVELICNRVKSELALDCKAKRLVAQMTQRTSSFSSKVAYLASALAADGSKS